MYFPVVYLHRDRMRFLKFPTSVVVVGLFFFFFVEIMYTVSHFAYTTCPKLCMWYITYTSIKKGKESALISKGWAVGPFIPDDFLAVDFNL